MLFSNLSGRKRSSEEIIRGFKSAAVQGSVIGNDFLDLSTVPGKSLCTYLRRLEKKLNDPRRDEYSRRLEHCWIESLCVWFQKGRQGLERLSQEDADDLYVGMCIAILSKNRSSENLSVLSRLLPKSFALPKNPNEFETEAGYCRDVLQTLTAGKQLEIDDETAARLRSFVHALLEKGVTAALNREKRQIESKNRQFPLSSDIFYFGPGLAVLKHVGDRSSIELILGLPDWSQEVAAERDNVVAEIQMRLKSNATKRQSAVQPKSARTVRLRTSGKG